MTDRPPLQHLGHGVFVIDSGYLRPAFDAIHLIVESDRAAIIDTGTCHSVPRIMAALDALGISPDRVDWVVLTHVHLDHAGGAGPLMQCLPAARLAVHPRGAPHMISPERLWAGTVAVYGEEEARRTYGELAAVAAQRVVEIPDGATLSLAGRTLQCFDAPGHARHHLFVRDEATGHLFAGDTFGISYRELDVDGRPFAFPSSTPVQFDPHALCSTVSRMLALQPEAVYLTHWSRIGDVPRVGATLLRLTDAYAQLAQEAREQHGAHAQTLLPALEQAMDRLLCDEARAHGCTLPLEQLQSLLALDIRLNAAGLLAWLASADRTRRPAG